MIELQTPDEIIPASTVVVFRQPSSGKPPELLMVQRAKEMRFAGGMAVFPGGRIDPQDRDLAARLVPDGDPDCMAARVAGIRETLEETGLAIGLRQKVSADEARLARQHLLDVGEMAAVLDRFGWELELEALTYFAHWRPNFHRAFDTRFYLADLGTGNVEVAVDATENTRLFWATAEQALGMTETGEIEIIYPTRRNLERLAQFATFAHAVDHVRSTPVITITPYREDKDGQPWLMIPEGAGYPVLGAPIPTAPKKR